MKKRFSRILSLVLTLMLLLSLTCQSAQAAGVSLSGDGSLRPGDSVTLTFSVGGKNIYALQGSLEYDSSQLTLLGSSCLLGSGWTMDMNGRTIVLSDTRLSSPINKMSAAFSVTFQVKDSVPDGKTVYAAVENVAVSDGERDSSLGDASWSAEISAPMSSDASLQALSCSQAALSPSFSPDTTSYRVTVPYDVTDLDLNYQTSDSNASVSVSGNELSVGSNTITVSVTAQDGSVRRYTIAATREQDPDYVYSTDATLSRLKTSTGRLSPAFSPEITSYVIYVPYEVSKITLTGTANDSKALGVANASCDELAEGDNLLQVSCTAEDGTTVQRYEIHVLRMPQYAGVLPQITIPTQEDDEAPQSDSPLKAAWSTLCAPVHIPLLHLYAGNLPLYVPVAAALLLLLVLLWLLGYIIGMRTRKKTEIDDEMVWTMAPPSAPAPQVSETEALELPPEEPLPDLGDISIDTLLDDIKNMD